MGCKSALYAANTGQQTIPVGGTISFGNVVRRFGQNIIMSGDGVLTKGAGYYKIDTNFSIIAGAAGTLVITLFKDGMPITGATASHVATSGSEYTISIPAIIKNSCCLESNISAVVSGVNATVDNAAISVVKV